MFVIPLMDVAVRRSRRSVSTPKFLPSTRKPAAYLRLLPPSLWWVGAGRRGPHSRNVPRLGGRAEEGRHPEAPIPWIYGIARHKLLDHYRKQARAEQPLADAASHSGVLSRCRMTVVARRAVAALAAVPASQRTALVLCYLDGFTAAEVGGELGKAPQPSTRCSSAAESFRRAYAGVEL